MAHFGGETSNHLFKALEEWNEYLEHHVPYFQESQLPNQEASVFRVGNVYETTSNKACRKYAEK